MNIVSYRPGALLAELRQEMDDLFGKFNGNMMRNIDASSWSIPLDIKEESEKIIVKADIPQGVDCKDIEITFEGNVLTIKGERSEEEKTEKKGYLQVERRSGSFCRMLSLPEVVDSEMIEAESKNNVLTITLPKKKGSSGKKIAVNDKK